MDTIYFCIAYEIAYGCDADWTLNTDAPADIYSADAETWYLHTETESYTHKIWLEIENFESECYLPLYNLYFSGSSDGAARILPILIDSTLTFTPTVTVDEYSLVN